MNKTKEQIDRCFKSYLANNDQTQAMQDIREGCKVLAMLIDASCPDGREKSLSLTNLEQVMFWANAGIARFE